MLYITLVALAIGWGACIAFSFAQSTSVSAWSIAGSAVMFSLAALLAGGFLGFLFGIPHVVAGANKKGANERNLLDGNSDGDSADADLPQYDHSTNLEQIADWLTKLLVGATLVQLGAFPGAAADLFDAMAPALGGTASSQAFAGAISIFFAVFGFILCWLLTRLLLVQAFGIADLQVASLSRRAMEAAQSGDTKKAGELVNKAGAVAAAASGAVVGALVTSALQKAVDESEMPDTQLAHGRDVGNPSGTDPVDPGITDFPSGSPEGVYDDQ